MRFSTNSDWSAYTGYIIRKEPAGIVEYVLVANGQNSCYITNRVRQQEHGYQHIRKPWLLGI